VYKEQATWTTFKYPLHKTFIILFFSLESKEYTEIIFKDFKLFEL